MCVVFELTVSITGDDIIRRSATRKRSFRYHYCCRCRRRRHSRQRRGFCCHSCVRVCEQASNSNSCAWIWVKFREVDGIWANIVYIYRLIHFNPCMRTELAIKQNVTVSQKTRHSTLAHNVAKCWPIFNIFSPSPGDSAMIVL